MKIREKNKNKYGVSLMISYVLLIFITISLSIGVYIWLKDYANVSEKINCKDGTSLIIENYNIEEKPTVKILNISIKNNGLFNVSGFLISAGNDSKKIPMQLLWPRYRPQPYAGYFDFEGFSGDQDLGPGQKQNAVFNVTEINKLEVIQIQPYIFKDNNIDKVFCEQALIKQIILINPSLIPGLVSWWKFDGNVLDYGDDNDGTKNGATYVNGRLNQGLKFDGSGEYVNVSTSTELTEAALHYTVAVWIKPQVDNDFWTGVVGKPGRNYNLWLGDSNNPSGGYVHHRFHNTTNTNSGCPDTPANSILMNKWSYVVITNNGTYCKTYINNEVKAEGVAANLVSDPTPLYIGRNLDGGNSNYFNGTIDEIAIYNKALSDWEVLQLYNSYNITS